MFQEFQKEISPDECQAIVNARNIEKLKLLDPNAKVTDQFSTPILQQCVGSAWAEGVEYLLMSNADISARNNSGCNAFYY